jgi:lipid II:glycine glycyltransferase (peptidoglycan interpeptide bridge formation enzyme)
VLWLPRTHEDAFAKFSTTRRRQVRKSHQSGVSVRSATDAASLDAYLGIHRKLSDDKERPEDYPRALFERLLALPDASLLLAEFEGVVVAGALFFRDGDSLFYWHGASDRAHAHVFPSCAIFDHAIALACREGFRSMNFGGSLGVSSLEEFKQSWGARRETYWKFTWSNPVWRAIKRVKGYSRALWHRRHNA